MKLKPLLIAVAVLAAGTGLAYWLSPSARNTGSAGSGTGAPFLEPDLLEQTRRIELAGNDGTAVLLERTGDDDWFLPEYHGMPVDFQKLSRFTRTLLDARIQRRVTANPERLERLNLGRNTITLRDDDGETLWEVELGDGGPAGGTFFRVAEEDTAYLTDTGIRPDTRTENWPNKRPLDLSSEDIASIELEFPGAESLLLEREEPGADFALSASNENRQAGTTELNSLLDTLLSARFNDVVDADNEDAAGAREHARRVTLRDFAGNGYTLRIGRRPAEPAESASETAASNESRSGSVEASIIFDQDGNIVQPPEPEPAEAAPETETETQPPEPGPVFIFYESTDPDFPWTGITENAALQFPDRIHNNLPNTPDALLEPEDPESEPAAQEAQ